MSVEEIEDRIARVRKEETLPVCSSCKTEMYLPKGLKVLSGRCSSCISKDVQIEQIVRPDKTPRRDRRKALVNARKQEKGRSTVRD